VALGQSYKADRALARKAKIANLGPNLGNRGAGSLLLIEEAQGWRVRTVATSDPDHDFGPFRSAIYDAGLLVWDGMSSPKYTPPNQINVRWTLDGLKVEALAANPESIDKANLAIATDDEGLGGVWRALPQSQPPCITAEMIRKREFLARELTRAVAK
jgi:hypothetical protein